VSALSSPVPLRCCAGWIGLDREVVIWREGGERDGLIRAGLGYEGCGFQGHVLELGPSLLQFPCCCSVANAVLSFSVLIDVLGAFVLVGSVV